MQIPVRFPELPRALVRIVCLLAVGDLLLQEALYVVHAAQVDALFCSELQRAFLVLRQLDLLLFLEKLPVEIVSIIKGHNSCGLAGGDRVRSGFLLCRLAFGLLEALVSLCVCDLFLRGHVDIVAALDDRAVDCLRVVRPQLHIQKLTIPVVLQHMSCGHCDVRGSAACQPAFLRSDNLQENGRCILVGVTLRKLDPVLGFEDFFRHARHNQLDRADVVTHRVDV